jgi:glycosyltransferase family protein
MAEKLMEIYKSNLPDHLLCVPYNLKNSSVSRWKARTFWEREWLGRYQMLCDLNIKRTFGDTNFVRFYMHRTDIKDYPSYIGLLKKIWENRDIVIVEGERTRMGIGNNLFDSAKSIRRILCPALNAFDKYDQILSTVKTVSNDKLILIALGPSATILAYDLNPLGYQSVDIGHIDIEYDWYQMKVRHKVAVPNKYVNEVHEGRIDSANLSDALYQSQIIARIE